MRTHFIICLLKLILSSFIIAVCYPFLFCPLFHSIQIHYYYILTMVPALFWWNMMLSIMLDEMINHLCFTFYYFVVQWWTHTHTHTFFLLVKELIIWPSVFWFWILLHNSFQESFDIDLVWACSFNGE